ncbi:MAG: hypothetical protein ABJC33_00955 [Betaproteobacteria bacterium]
MKHDPQRLRGMAALAVMGTLAFAGVCGAQGATQGSATTAKSPAPSDAPVDRQLHGITPNRAELAISAFGKLDAENKGYVTLENVTQLEGFRSAFLEADQNHDGRLNASEFNSAWARYTGNNP